MGNGDGDDTHDHYMVKPRKGTPLRAVAMLITFVALGNWLQAYTRGKRRRRSALCWSWSRPRQLAADLGCEWCRGGWCMHEHGAGTMSKAAKDTARALAKALEAITGQHSKNENEEKHRGGVGGGNEQEG